VHLGQDRVFVHASLLHQLDGRTDNRRLEAMIAASALDVRAHRCVGDVTAIPALFAAVVGARRDEVIFTSGTTESNNLALLGLRDAAEQQGRRHVITTSIEHKAVLEPMERLEAAGFEVTRLAVDASGAVDPTALRNALRPETWLVSIMQVNNETGVGK
jgi:cysteine sulfinate desulfinase/cysteine desulfurase-like protein